MDSNPLTAALSAISFAESDPLSKIKARALLIGYDARYLSRYARARIISVERSFVLNLINPDTNGQSQTFDVAGKIDVEIEEDGQVKIIEHKTTADSVEPGSDYWDRLAMDSQVSAYFVASVESGLEPVSVIYDAIRKPGISIRQVPVTDAEGLKVVIDALGNRVFNANGKPRLTGDTEKGYVLQSRAETIEEYGARLEEDIADRPAFYFGYREIARTDDQIVEWIGDTWAQSQQILYARRKALWPRNPSACTMMGRCEFFGLCAGHRSITDYSTRQSLHPELDVKENGKEFLTNSRLLAYRKCARLHKLRYEDRLELAGEEAEALAFGTLVHAGLEAWYKSIQQLNQEERIQS